MRSRHRARSTERLNAGGFRRFGTDKTSPAVGRQRPKEKKGKRPAARRCDLLPLLPSGPDGVQRELAVRDLPFPVRGIPAICRIHFDKGGAQRFRLTGGKMSSIPPCPPGSACGPLLLPAQTADEQGERSGERGPRAPNPEIGRGRKGHMAVGEGGFPAKEGYFIGSPIFGRECGGKSPLPPPTFVRGSEQRHAFVPAPSGRSLARSTPTLVSIGAGAYRRLFSWHESENG